MTISLSFTKKINKNYTIDAPINNFNAGPCRCKKTIDKDGAATSLDVYFLDDENDDDGSASFVAVRDRCLFFLYYSAIAIAFLANRSFDSFDNSS